MRHHLAAIEPNAGLFAWVCTCRAEGRSATKAGARSAYRGHQRRANAKLDAAKAA